MATVVIYTRGATANRQWLISQLEAWLPGVTEVGFRPGSPGVFYFRVGDGELVELTLNQVEPFVAALRIGFLHGRGKLTVDETRRALTHKF